MGVYAADATTKGSNNKENSSDDAAAVRRTIPTAATFAKIRQAYFTAKQQHVSAYELEEECDHDETLRSALKEKGDSGFVVPVEIRQTDDVGRGLFVKNTLVPKGKPVAVSTHYGIFYTEKQWNSFLELLDDSDLVYDVVIWSYVMKWDDEEDEEDDDDDEDDVYVVGLDLDEGSLINHGSMPCEVGKLVSSSDSPDVASRSSSPTGEAVVSKSAPTTMPANIHYIESENTFFAIHDLEPGTELRCDYSLFHEENHNLTWYDKTWEEVVGEEEEQLH